MTAQTRGAVVLLCAAGMVASLVSAVAPAGAATAPDWPSSRVPSGTGCTIDGYTPSTSSESGLNEYAYTDTQVPTVTGWTANGRRTDVTLPPGTTLVTFRVTARQTCSGVGSVTSGLLKGSTRLSDAFPFLRDSTDAFASTWAAGVPMRTSDVGAYRIPTVNVTRRYASFVLTDLFSLVSKADESAPATIVTGSWSTQVLYVRRATTQVSKASASTVSAGRKVTVRTTLRKAEGSTWVASPGSIVLFQTRYPGGKWVTRATRTTNTLGVAVWSFKPTRSVSWRWVHKGTKSGTFTAPSTSSARSLRVR
jgi:hypothetical protein